jgi:RNA exonuclease 4
MEVKTLSSNWKKLQVTLKDNTAPKEKKKEAPSNLQNGLKRKRSQTVIEKKTDRPRKFSRVKSMTDIVDRKISGRERRQSLREPEDSVVADKKQPRDGKVNEGFNET